jgi:hypothetical protein
MLATVFTALHIITKCRCIFQCILLQYPQAVTKSEGIISEKTPDLWDDRRILCFLCPYDVKSKVIPITSPGRLYVGFLRGKNITSLENSKSIVVTGRGRR